MFRVRFFILFIFTALSLSCFSQTRKINIDSIIGLMTIEEKVGQMTQIDLGVVAQGDICNLKNPQKIDIDKLKISISKYPYRLNSKCGLWKWNHFIG